MIGRFAILAWVLLLCAGLHPPGAEGHALRIIYTTELHGNLMPCSCPVRPLGGLARRIGWVDSLRSCSDPAPLLVVDAGQFLPRSGDFPRLTREAREDLTPLYRDAMRAMGYDAVVGLDIQPNEVKVIERGGFRVAIAAADEALDTKALAVRLHQAGPVDVAVALCNGDLSFAAATACRIGAKVAIASRGACFGGPVWQEGILVLGPGSAGRYVGLARIDVAREGTVRPLDIRLRPMDATVPADPAWRERVEKTVLDIEGRLPGAFTAVE